MLMLTRFSGCLRKPRRKTKQLKLFPQLKKYAISPELIESLKNKNDQNLLSIKLFNVNLTSSFAKTHYTFIRTLSGTSHTPISLGAIKTIRVCAKASMV